MKAFEEWQESLCFAAVGTEKVPCPEDCTGCEKLRRQGWKAALEWVSSQMRTLGSVDEAVKYWIGDCVDEELKDE